MFLLRIPKFTKSVTTPSLRRSYLTVVDQSQVAFREFLGSNRTKLNPGIHLKLPFLHTLHKISMKEQRIVIQNLNAYTEDNVPVSVNGVLFIKVVNPEFACYNVDNYISASQSVGQSAVRAIIGKFQYDNITSNRNHVNAELVKTIGDNLSSWGTVCTRFEIQEFFPQNREVGIQLEKQMQAERSRRENELNTLAEIRSAEGRKTMDILKADAEFYTKQREIEGKNLEVRSGIETYQNAIENLNQSTGGDSEKSMNFLLEMERLKHLQSIANGQNKTIYFLDPTHNLPKNGQSQLLNAHVFVNK